MACSGTGNWEIVRAIHKAPYMRARYRDSGQEAVATIQNPLLIFFKVAVSENKMSRKKKHGGGEMLLL